MALDTDVLIVGAGPIGLINAWGMKRLNPALNIIVLEKYAEYQRSHTLVMQAAKLEAVMKATNSLEDPILADLLKQLRRDPNIRTNILQQTFSQLAKESGVEIKTEQAVKIDTIHDTIKEDYPNVRLIIGADGTHSVVSKALFPPQNQVKKEFDYVLQLRFDIKGREKAPGVRIRQFYQQMARKGLIANEYVGHFKDGKTPVTMQMMISKDDFEVLESFKSNNPLKPYAAIQDNTGVSEMLLPQRLDAFIKTYLRQKIADTVERHQEIEGESIRISVNEAPATYAKKIVNQQDKAHVVLQGDAALGLSYFKGLNAGLKACARFFKIMAPVIQDGFKNKEKTREQLETYQTWVLRVLSPKKIKEVARYSFWRIRAFMKGIRLARSYKNISMKERDDEALDGAIQDYFGLLAGNPKENELETPNPSWTPFPHRSYDLVKFAQFEQIPLRYTAKKIAKIFLDYIRPYKNSAQILQDFKQPLVGIANFFIGLEKTIVGLVQFKLSAIPDGLFNIFRGLIELATTPLNWIIKPIFRGLATSIHGGYKKIEENKGIQNLAEYGHDYLNGLKKDDLMYAEKTYELLAVCNDIHRKFEKSLMRGQPTHLEIKEKSEYIDIRSNKVLDTQKLRHYFSLFSPKKENSLEISNTPRDLKSARP